jgi:uncharacterized protein YodC (DUF2158 family)
MQTQSAGKETPPKVGDLVKLKSGGPTMTVVDFDEAKPEVTTNHFDDQDALQTNYFPPEALKSAET